MKGLSSGENLSFRHSVYQTVFQPDNLDASSNETSMHQLKDRHGLIALLALSLAVYVQFPLFALDFRHGIQNESSSQRKGGNEHERHG